MQNKSIQVKGLQMSYKKLQVLKGVDFEVDKGSIFALLGSNGAGNTTAVE
ncbi:nucleoside triphosphate hydrolase [Cytobacillus dafuensis]|uniref:Nucleoside triphosphate hydrolase n=1 Tax=Cytobacillus dafuensis TaxID=1742359 RepID=A0A5B8Z473_CYTDA|nr:nucleoside triphosphate hydrolase [Cytobacillus dafuensis]